MGIKRIEARNFKSFQEFNVDLGKFNLIIGANASGKSNFIRIFEFLRDITTSGLDNAVSLQGGVDYLRNMNIGFSENLSIKLVSGAAWRGWFGRGKIKDIEIVTRVNKITYEFALKFAKRGSKFRIAEDKLTLEMVFSKFKEKEEISRAEVFISRSDGKIKVDFDKSSDVPLEKEDIYPLFLLEALSKQSKHALLLEMPYLVLPLQEFLPEIAIYDFDPRLPKKATPITGKAELEEDGSNLSIILKNIIENKENRRKLFNLVKDLLPFVENLDVERFADKSLLFKLKESYFKTEYLPASLISDGTINMTALIVALYFEKKPLIIIEEPERNIHPSLISKEVEMMKDASRRKQILVTTHNPEFVKYAGIENILLISRDKNGFSIISRPENKEEIKTFLKNNIGIEELYIQNLL